MVFLTCPQNSGWYCKGRPMFIVSLYFHKLHSENTGKVTGQVRFFCFVLFFQITMQTSQVFGFLICTWILIFSLAMALSFQAIEAITESTEGSRGSEVMKPVGRQLSNARNDEERCWDLRENTASCSSHHAPKTLWAGKLHGRMYYVAKGIM